MTTGREHPVASGAGGGPDIGSRLIGAQLTRQMGQQVVVDNRPGASGAIGTEAVVCATPDGYTLGQGNFTSLGTNRILLPKLPYDPDRDVQPLIMAYLTRNMLAINRELPIASVPELVAHAKRNPRKLMYGSSAVGSSMHFSGALFGLMTGVEMTPWAGFIAPAGVPKPILARLNAEINKALNAPAVRENLIELGLEPRGGTPQEFANFIRSETAKWRDVATRANVRLE